MPVTKYTLGDRFADNIARNHRLLRRIFAPKLEIEGPTLRGTVRSNLIFGKKVDLEGREAGRYKLSKPGGERL